MDKREYIKGRTSVKKEDGGKITGKKGENGEKNKEKKTPLHQIRKDPKKRDQQ